VSINHDDLNIKDDKKVVLEKKNVKLKNTYKIYKILIPIILLVAIIPYTGNHYLQNNERIIELSQVVIPCDNTVHSTCEVIEDIELIMPDKGDFKLQINNNNPNLLSPADLFSILVRKQTSGIGSNQISNIQSEFITSQTEDILIVDSVSSENKIIISFDFPTFKHSFSYETEITLFAYIELVPYFSRFLYLYFWIVVVSGSFYLIPIAILRNNISKIDAILRGDNAADIMNQGVNAYEQRYNMGRRKSF
jgi:hypothetical protein